MSLYDNHTVYCYEKSFSEGDVIKCIEEALSRVKKLVPDANLSYRLNHLVDKDGQPKGHNYIFVRDSRVYNILVGRTADGKPCIEKIKRDEGQVSGPISKPLFAQLGGSSGSWGDDDEEDTSTVERHYSLIGTILHREVPLTFHPAHSKEEENTSFVISAIFNGDLRPEEIDEIRKTFSFFAVSQPVGKEYPIIKIQKGRNNLITIGYYPGSNDALFALLMRKFFTLRTTKRFMSWRLYYDSKAKGR